MVRTDVRVRQATPRDTSSMLEITRAVWEGNDYVPYVWDDWLDHSGGYASVAEVHGEIAGLMHTDVQPDGVGWMEGIRVRDNMQSQGIGLKLLEDGIEWARRAGCSRLRLATYGANPSSNRLAAKAGLTELVRMRSLRTEPHERGSAGSNVRIALPFDLDSVWAFIEQHHDAGTPLLYTEGWTAFSLTRQRLALLLATHAVLVAGSDLLHGVAIATLRPGRPVLRVGYLNGEAEAMERLMSALMRQAEREQVPVVSSTLPLSDEIANALKGIGIDSEDVHEMVVYELDLEAG